MIKEISEKLKKLLEESILGNTTIEISDGKCTNKWSGSLLSVTMDFFERLLRKHTKDSKNNRLLGLKGLSAIGGARMSASSSVIRE